ncbi:hypothetical protein ACF0H5_006624 [Mactra antiquata]
MNSFLYGLFLLICLFNEVSSKHTVYCYMCKGISDPHDCTTMVTCYNAACTTDAYLKDGNVSYDLGCHLGCHAIHEDPLLFGKRSITDKGTLLCEACRADYTDQIHACRSYMHHQYTTEATTLAPASQQPTTHAQTIMTTYDMPQTNTAILDSTTHAPMTDVMASTETSMNSTVLNTHEQSTVLPSTVLTPIVQTTNSDCVDYEKDDFTCTEWKSYGFCDASTGAGYTIALERCRKTCGFC